MKITHSDLIKIYKILMDALSQSDVFHTEIDFLYDYYWNIPIEKRQDVCITPELDIGSIGHDLERIQQCIQDNEPMHHHLRYLGNILIAVADTISHRFMQGESMGIFGVSSPPSSGDSQ